MEDVMGKLEVTEGYLYPYITRKVVVDDLLDFAGMIYSSISDEVTMTFEQFYNKYFNHEEVWRKICH